MATCSVDECNEKAVGRGWCRKHYMRWKRKGSTDDTRKNARGVCSEPGCFRPHVAKGLCDSHYRSGKARRKRKVRRAQRDRICECCGKSIPAERNGRAKFCSYECKTAFHNQYTERRHKWQQEYFLRQKYGLSLQEYEQLVEQQDGRCAICGCDQPAGRGRWHVDHDHTTGKVRGLLCHNCNVGLGNFKDDPRRLEAAVKYLTLDYTP